MKKLSSKDIEEMLSDYSEGESVIILSKCFRVSKGTIYYHIKVHSMNRKVEPIKYLDHIRNRILDIQARIDNGEYTKEQLPHARGEIIRLKQWLKVDRRCLPSDPFVLS